MASLAISKYAILHPNVSFHIYPHGTILQREVENHDIRKRVSTFTLNESAKAILSLCDGSRTVGQILEQTVLYFSGNFEKIFNQSHNYLQQMVKESYVQLLDFPTRNNTIQITGSANYYIPRHLSIELTDACNLRCGHCYRNSGRQQSNELPLKVLIPIIEEFSKIGVRVVELTGGEPTFYREFDRALEVCVNCFHLVAVVSNGYFFNEERIAEMVKFRNKIVVQIDLDGPNPEIHAQIRGSRASFYKAASAIQKLTNNGIIVRAVMNLFSGNFAYIEDVCCLAKKLGATAFSASPILDIGRGKTMQGLSIEQLRLLSGRIEKMKEEYPNFIFSGENLSGDMNKEGENCGAGWRSMVLGPTGTLRPCLMLPESYLSFGNVVKNKMLDVLSQAPSIFMHNLPTPNKEICGDCNFHPFCTSCMIRPIYAKEMMLKNNKEWQCRWNNREQFLQKINIPN